MFTLRQIFLAIAIVSVVSLIVSMGVAGEGWAMGVAFGLMYLLIVGFLMWLSFCAVEVLSQLRGAMEDPNPAEFSPFRAERPEKMPDRPETPDLERMMPGWSADGDKPTSQQNGTGL